MKPIYILTPYWIRTGGPEAQHQLSDALLEQGFDARLVYYTPDDISGYGEENGRIVPWVGIPKLFPERTAPSFEEYARYKINPVRSLDCSTPCVVVLSETLVHLTPMFPDHVTVLIWWLSVDNAFGALGQVNLNQLRKANVRHAYQSRYAERFSDALGFVGVGQLTDYTVDLSEYATPLPWGERPKLVTLATGRKVIADLDAVIAELQALDPAIECVRIENMSRAQVAALYAKARVHIDLGNFPGKDRGPREATTMGCCPLAAHAGAADETGAFLCGSTDPAAIAESAIALMRGEPQFFMAPERQTFFREAREIFSGL